MIEASNYFFKTGKDTTSNYYYFPTSTDNRLHFLFNHPKLEILKELGDKYQTELLENVCLEPIHRGEQPIYDENGGVLVIKTVNLKDGYINYPNCLKVSRDFFEKSSSAQVRKGDILIASTGYVSMGKVDVYNRDESALASVDLLIIKVKPEYDPYFVAYFLRSRLGQLQFEKWFSGSSGQIHVYEEDLNQFILPKLSLPKQKEIANKITEKINESFKLKNEANNIRSDVEKVLLKELGVEIPKTEDISYFFKTGREGNSLFFPTVFEEFSDKFNYLFYHPKMSLLNTLREKCDVIQFEDVCEVPIHRGEQPVYDETGDVLVIKTVDLKNGYIDYENCLRVSHDFFKKNKTAQVKKGDILIASTGYVSMGKVDVYNRDEYAMIDGHVSILRIKENYDPYFVAYFLRSHLGQLQFEKRFSGSSGQIEIQPEDLNQFILPKLSLPKQKEIANKITEQIDKSFEHRQKAKGKKQEAKDTFERLILET